MTFIHLLGIRFPFLYLKTEIVFYVMGTSIMKIQGQQKFLYSVIKIFNKLPTKIENINKCTLFKGKMLS